jgi:hypothetical protein
MIDEKDMPVGNLPAGIFALKTEKISEFWIIFEKCLFV